MLASQRALFEMPRDICYLNSASYSPLPLRTQDAGRAAIGRKGKPWTLDADFANRQHERARTAAARLIHADPADIALIPSIGYGVATAAKVLTIDRGARVIVLEDDHSSPVLEWQTRAAAQGFTVETVRRPGDGDWTSAVLAAIERSGAPPLSLKRFPPDLNRRDSQRVRSERIWVHWFLFAGGGRCRGPILVIYGNA